jgi:hypothetical protein
MNIFMIMKMKYGIITGIHKLSDKSKNINLLKKVHFLHKQVITNNRENNWIDYLQKSKKKDDLCDCYLQRIYLINIKN